MTGQDEAHHTTGSLAHRHLRMRGRDPHEVGRVASPLELLFDLTFVVAFGTAGNQLAHAVAAGHAAQGAGAFALSMFAICWAWINFSWFASAFDTDDWVYRLTTMVQMIGVVIVAIGIPDVFHSLLAGHTMDNTVMVFGYIVMRVAMVGQWLRAARQAPRYRRTCLTYATAILVAQAGWVVLLVSHLPLGVGLVAGVTLILVEMAGPVVAERTGEGTPWHAHHIAERYGLMAIITLGEGVVGTVASLGTAASANGWDLDTALVALAGMGLTFGMWWVYFILPSGVVLHLRRDRAFVWGYLHIAVFGAIAAVGAGLHVAAYVIERRAGDADWVLVDTPGAVLSVALPVGVFMVLVFALHYHLVEARLARPKPLHTVLLLLTAAIIVLAFALGSSGVSMSWCLVVVMLAPMVTVAGYELLGHRHLAQALGRLG